MPQLNEEALANVLRAFFEKHADFVRPVSPDLIHLEATIDFRQFAHYIAKEMR